MLRVHILKQTQSHTLARDSRTHALSSVGFSLLGPAAKWVSPPSGLASSWYVVAHTCHAMPSLAACFVSAAAAATAAATTAGLAILPRAYRPGTCLVPCSSYLASAVLGPPSPFCRSSECLAWVAHTRSSLAAGTSRGGGCGKLFHFLLSTFPPMQPRVN